jgi:Protein of unknown function (DUF551)
MTAENKDLQYYRKNAEEDYPTTPISVLGYISRLEEYASIKVSEASGFISVKDRLPETEDNVLAILDGKVCVMRCFPMVENDVTYWVWGRVYDGLDGDAIYDEDYYPTDWMPIPNPNKN